MPEIVLGVGHAKIVVVSVHNKSNIKVVPESILAACAAHKHDAGNTVTYGRKRRTQEQTA